MIPDGLKRFIQLQWERKAAYDRSMADTNSDGKFTLYRPQRSRRLVLGVAAGVIALGGFGYLGYALLAEDDETDDPQVVAAQNRLDKFLKAWESGEAKEAGTHTDTPDNAESLVASVMKNLDPSKTDIEHGDGEKKAEGRVNVPFTVDMNISGVGDFSWESKAAVHKKSGQWTVVFTTPMIHPKMVPGQTLALKTADTRASVLDRNGEELVAASLVGTVDERTGKGVSGLEARYDKRLSGGGAKKAVVVADRESGQTVKPLSRSQGKKGKPVKTTVDPQVQEAAADALSDVKKNAALVAVDPRNGHILAAANTPSGSNRAFEGRYPPGSTFKVVTTAALLQEGVSPDDPARCPKYAHVNGQRFENQDEFTLPAGSTFTDVFARSCNTYFVNARDKLGNTALNRTSEAFGIGGTWDVGVTTYDGSVPTNTSANDRAAATIGQARVQTSPLVMASIAATVRAGEFQQPVLVPEEVKKRHQAPGELAPEVASQLRTLMRTTATSGSADVLKGLSGKPHAKTGTAEYGNKKPPRTHAWMIGYQHSPNLAWAVLLEDGGSGGADAGPLAKEFLDGVT